MKATRWWELSDAERGEETSTSCLMFVSVQWGEGDGTPLQHFCLESPMDGGAWWAAAHGVAGSRTRLSDFPFPFPFHELEKKMATHSSVLAWRIPGTGEPGGLPSMGSHRVGHDWSDLAAAAAAAVAVFSGTTKIYSNLLFQSHQGYLPGLHKPSQYFIEPAVFVLSGPRIKDHTIEMVCPGD